MQNLKIHMHFRIKELKNKDFGSILKSFLKYNKKNKWLKKNFYDFCSFTKNTEWNQKISLNKIGKYHWMNLTNITEYSIIKT